MDFDSIKRRQFEEHPLVKKMMRDSAVELIKDWEKQYKSKNGNELRKSLTDTLKTIPEIATFVGIMLNVARERGFKFEDEGGMGI